MKRILAVAAMVAVTSANANELKFGDLNYFFKSGEKVLSVDYNFERETWGPSSGTAGTNNRTAVRGQYIDSKFTYGIADNLNASILLTYNFDVEITDKSDTSRSKVDEFQAPMLAVDYRVMNQGSSGFNLDIGAKVKYNLQDAEVGNAADEGNIVSPELTDRTKPSNWLELNARLGNKWNEANEYYLLGGVVYNMATDYETTSGTDIERDSSMDLKLGAFYQYRPVNEFMMNVGLVATKVAEFDEEIGATKTEVDGHLDFDFIFQAKYLVKSNVIVRFNYEQGRNEDYDYGTEAIEKRKEHLYGFGVDWLF